MSPNRKIISAALGAVVIAILIYLFWPGATAPFRTDQTDESERQAAGPGQTGESKPGNVASDPAVSGQDPSMIENPGARQQAASRRQGFTVRGMILTERGDRLPDARIEVCELGADTPCSNPLTAFSDTSGFYELQLELDTEKQRLISVQKPGFLTTEGILQMKTPGGIEQDYVLRSASSSLKGRVMGPGRRTVSGAQVIVTCLSDGKARWRDTPVGYSTTRAWSSTATTNANGEFVLPGLPTGNATVQARAPQYLQNNIHRVALQSGENSVEIQLDAARLISILVKNRRGQPLDNVTARAVAPEIDTPFFGATERQGIVELNIPPSVTRIECELTARNYQAKVVKISAAAPPAEVVLDDGWVLRGTVVSTSGQPLPGSRVIVGSFRSSGGRTDTQAEGQATTDGTGRFELAVSSDHFLRVFARRQGYLETRLWLENLDDQELRIVLRPPDGALHGVVLNPSGKPATQFQIQLRQARTDLQSAPDFLSQARADILFSTAARFDDPAGRFEFPELPAGNLILRVSDVQGSPSLSKTQTVEVRRGVNAEIVIQLEGTN